MFTSFYSFSWHIKDRFSERINHPIIKSFLKNTPKHSKPCKMKKSLAICNPHCDTESDPWLFWHNWCLSLRLQGVWCVNSSSMWSSHRKRTDRNTYAGQEKNWSFVKGEFRNHRGWILVTLVTASMGINSICLPINCHSALLLLNLDAMVGLEENRIKDMVI